MPNLQNQKASDRRILLAEDHQPTREVLARVLKKAGYIVDTAPNGTDAFQLFQVSPRGYDLIITDHDMPELDGLGFVKKVREAGFGGRIIVLSGGLSDANSSTYTNFRVAQIFAKPISSHALLEEIQATGIPRQNSTDPSGSVATD